MYIYIYCRCVYNIYHCLSKHIVDSVPERVELLSTSGSGLCNPAIIPNGHIIIPIRFHYTEYVNMQKIVRYISLYTILCIYIYSQCWWSNVINHPYFDDFSRTHKDGRKLGMAYYCFDNISMNQHRGIRTPVSSWPGCATRLAARMETWGWENIEKLESWPSHSESFFLEISIWRCTWSLKMM